MVEMQYERNDMNVVRGQVPAARRFAHHPAELRRAGRPRRFLRRRGRAHRRARPADRRDPGRAGRDRDLPGQALRHQPRTGLAMRIAGHRGRTGRAARRSSSSRARSSKPRGWKSARTTTSSRCARRATAPASRTTPATSRRREPGSTPWCLLDYFPDDWLLVVDESHITLPQVQGQYFGDRARKDTLVEFGFRLPSAIDNRPLTFEEFDRHINQVHLRQRHAGRLRDERSTQVVEQVIRPTGLLDPEIEVRPTQEPDRRPDGRDRS